MLRVLGEVRSKTVLAALVAAVLVVPGWLAGESQTARHSELPHFVAQQGRHALFVDGAPFLMLGMQMNNSSAWPSMLPKVWSAAEELRANTVEAPIYWEQFEPRPGVFDDTVLHALLSGARAHHLKLVLLWFGTWKNGSGHYTPVWMKQNNALYPRVVGKNGRLVDSLSPHGAATLAADRRAFATLMRHLKAADPQQTVLMVQVENEPGSWGSVRDYSAEAETLFKGPVPVTLLTALDKSPGTWAQVFGEDADETFHAWSIARYIEQVAEAGKAEYPLPMYANVALRDPIHPGKATSYESGGATDNMLPVWKAAAPSLDALAPDLYMPEYEKFDKVLELYARPDNPLLLVELGKQPAYARYFFAAMGRHTVGFAPFGTDFSREDVDEKTLQPFAALYGVAAPMDRELARLNFEGRLQGIAEDPAVHDRTLEFAGWRATVSFGRPTFGFGEVSTGNGPPSGGAIVAQLGPNEFLVTALHARVDFSPVPATTGLQRQFMRVEEGTYRNRIWTPERILNGDQTDYGLNFASVPRVLRVSLGTF